MRRQVDKLTRRQYDTRIALARSVALSPPHLVTPSLHARRRGTVLLVVMLIISALAAMVLVVGRSARVEAMASANYAAGAKAAAAERAAEQYVLALLASRRAEAMTMKETYFADVPVGDAGSFWIVRPDYGDQGMPAYGLVDESSKLNVNSPDVYELVRAFDAVPEALANSIADWRDEDDEPSVDGAEKEYYLGLPTPYRCKNAAFEAIDELLLVRGIYPALLYGTGKSRLAANAAAGLTGMTIGALGEAEILERGLENYLTVYASEPNEGEQRSTLGRINVNTASREVMMCLPRITEADVSALVARRSAEGFGSTDTAGISEVFGNRAGQIMSYVTGESYVFSADIVAASRDGRAFRRVRIVVDASNDALGPRIIYRRDLTDRGWPLDPAVLDSMRASGGLRGK